MKISEDWLREWVAPKLDAAALAQRLTLGGFEVASLARAAPVLSRVVVGRIRSVDPHPKADRLRVCGVEVGGGKTLAIVSGADNTRPGLKVATALPGAQLRTGRTVQAAEIRGVHSVGVLCSAAELGLGESADTLLILGAEARPGQALERYLRLDDMVLEIELTPNRGDCLSIAGVAREVAALTGARLKTPRVPKATVRSRRTLPLKLLARADCPRYCGRVIEGIDPRVTPPLWLVERLRRSGLRSIGPVVDVTNYVMLELGQPMHAFDLDCLARRVEVRSARDGEGLTLLDGSERRLTAGMLVIADAERVLALAGIMGGRDSGVSETTRNIFLESAHFRPETVGRTARGLGLQTESSYRFERGVDPQLQGVAIERATALLLDIVGGRPGPVLDRALARFVPKRKPVLLRRRRVARLLNFDPGPGLAPRILRRLGMRVAKSNGGWRVTAPSYRFDIEREVDLIEEIARVHGYERLPSRMPRISMGSSAASEARVPTSRLKEVLVDRDYQEVITYSFVDPALQALIAPSSHALKLANPISAEMAVMRVSLWPGLLQTVRYNRNRQQGRLRFFELGRCFVPTEQGLTQEPMLGGVISGPALREQWGAAPQEADFYDLKGDVEALLELTGDAQAFRFTAGKHPGLHPGQQARVSLEGQEQGWLGALHPQVAAKLELSGPILLFELQASALQQGRVPAYREVSRFPAIRRDLAVVVDEGVSARQVMECVAAAAGELLVDLQLFDQYRGKGIDSGRKSLALALTLQDYSRTLREEAVETVVGRVIETLQSRLRAELRKK